MRLGNIYLAALALLLVGCVEDHAKPLAARHGDKQGAVTVHTPTGLRGVETGERDAQGRAITVACSTCHSLEISGAKRDFQKLTDFHRGMRFDHGGQACVACHDAKRPDRLHLASGAQVALADTMDLCRQCHGPQTRDYRHGSHGGMNGHWDLTRGERLRNHCVDCHDPHTPAFDAMQPVLLPKDRRPLAPPDSTQSGAHP